MFGLEHVSQRGSLAGWAYRAAFVVTVSAIALGASLSLALADDSVGGALERFGFDDSDSASISAHPTRTILASSPRLRTQQLYARALAEYHRAERRRLERSHTRNRSGFGVAETPAVGARRPLVARRDLAPERLLSEDERPTLLERYQNLSRSASRATASGLRGIYQALFGPAVAQAQSEIEAPREHFTLEEIERLVHEKYRSHSTGPADELERF